jgi:hypothetical protein
MLHLLQAHFDESQFEQNRQDGKKLLKWNAVPTLFNNSIRQKRTIKRHFQKNRDSEDKASPGNHLYSVPALKITASDRSIKTSFLRVWQVMVKGKTLAKNQGLICAG